MIQHAMTIFKRFIFYSNYLVLSEKDCMGLLCNVWNRSWKTPIWGKSWSSRVLDFMKYKLNMSKYVDSKIEKLLIFFFRNNMMIFHCKYTLEMWYVLKKEVKAMELYNYWVIIKNILSSWILPPQNKVPS